MLLFLQFMSLGKLLILLLIFSRVEKIHLIKKFYKFKTFFLFVTFLKSFFEQIFLVLVYRYIIYNGTYNNFFWNFDYQNITKYYKILLSI